MKIAILFDIPDSDALDMGGLAGQLIARHRFAADNDLPVWSFNAHMRPVGASVADTDEEAISGLTAAVKHSGVAFPPS